MESDQAPLPPQPSDNRGRLARERFRFRRVNEITGTFVLVVLAALIAAIVWTGHSQRWFKSRVNLKIELPPAGAAGIRQGSEVYFLGTLVGSVSSVEVDTMETTGHMEAVVNIRRDFFRYVRADSIAVVKKKFGVAGDSFFEISRGKGQPLPENNASIVCKEQFQSALETAVEEVRKEAMQVLKKTTTGLDTWTKLGTGLGDSREHLDAVIVRLNNLATGIEQGKGTVGKLMSDTALADEAQKLLAHANETMSQLQVVATNLNVAVKNVENSTTRLPEITDSVANEAKDLPGLVRQTQSSMREMERLVEAMQRHWLLRRFVNLTNPPPTHPLPEIAEPETVPLRGIHSPKG